MSKQQTNKTYFAHIEVIDGHIRIYQISDPQGAQMMRDTAEQEGIYYLQYEVKEK